MTLIIGMSWNMNIGRAKETHSPHIPSAYISDASFPPGRPLIAMLILHILKATTITTN